MDAARRRWDKMAEIVEYYVLNSIPDPLVRVTPEVAAEWKAAADLVRAEIGERP